MTRRLFLILLLTAITLNSIAQTITERQEVTAVVGTGKYAPMWHMANRQGKSCAETGMTYTLVGTGGNHQFSAMGLGLNWDFDIIAGTHLTSAIYVQQANVDIEWKKMRLSIGQKERWGELNNYRLTSGALVESGNARPIPQVRFELPEYWVIPGTKDWFAIKGHLAYGMFTDGKWQKKFLAPQYNDNKQYAENTIYHSKAGYLRFGNETKFPLTAEIGLHMVTQFGGTTYNAKNHAGEAFHNPTRFKDFLLALIPLSGDDKYDGSDQLNVAGNVLGSWLGAITWKDENWMLKLNYEHTFDDHSQMFWEYGLWTEQLVGIELELKDFKWIKATTFEYFNLKNQSGPIYHDSNNLIPDQISCIDNNYNHGKYPGWFNYGQMIATPLCTSPIYNEDNTLTCYNNRVEAFHLGMEGSLTEWFDYRLLYTHSNNWGTYEKPFKDIKHNTSGLVEFTFKPSLHGGMWSITTSFAFDRGNLYGNNYGGLITIKRCGIYNLSKKAR